MNIKKYFLLPVLPLLFFPQIVVSEIVDKVIAVVNDDVITLSELEKETEGIYSRVAQSESEENVLTAINKARNDALDSMIDQRLIQQKADQLGVNVSPGEVDAAFEQMRTRNNLSPDEFILKLHESGLSEEAYRKRLQESILQNKLLSIDVRSKIVVTDDMVQDYYNNSYLPEMGGETYYLLQIGLDWDANLSGEELQKAKNEAKNTAEKARNLALEGKDFKQLARDFSNLPSAEDGGDLGTFTLDEMASAMKDAVKNLQAGQISPILETSAGYQFFKLLSKEKNPSVTTTPYDEVKEDIKEKLYDEKLKKTFKQWVDDLKNNAYIQKL